MHVAVIQLRLKNSSNFDSVGHEIIYDQLNGRSDQGVLPTVFQLILLIQVVLTKRYF